jgi:hypothetical protein
MGNPHRFFGTGEAIDLGEEQVLPARCAVEVTFRCHQQRHLLRPDDEANEILLGCFGRAYDRYPDLNPNALATQSNHGCFVCLPLSSFTLWSFMRDFLSTSARRLNDLRDRDGTFWERRYRAIPILDEEAYDDRIRYVLTQGTKENLLWSARDWPGASSLPAMLGEEPLVGRWRDLGREYELNRQRKRRIMRAQLRGRTLDVPPAPEVVIEYPIPMVPPPHWQRLSEGERRERVADMIRRDDEATRARHAREGTRPLGVEGVLATDPFARPKAPKRDPAPRCHTSNPALRRAFLQASRAHADLIAGAAAHALAALEQHGLPVSTPIAPLCRRPAPAPRRPPPERVTRRRQPTPRTAPPTRSRAMRSMGSCT